MTNPAQPAEPRKPEPYVGTGGYTGPAQRTQRTPRSDGTLPGTPTPPGAPLPAQSPGASPSPVQTSPVGVTPPGAAPGGPGLPAAAQNLGLDEEGYQEILEDAKASTNPEEFKTQFSQLMEQRSMIAPRTQGNGVPTDDYGKYLSKWVREAVAYGASPSEFGGLGYTEPQAKMMAIMEARRRWPDIAPSFWATSLPGGQLSQKEMGFAKPKEGAAAVEVGPMRAAKIDPNKISDILIDKDFKSVYDRAKDYKERSGNAANAVDFAKDVMDARISERVTQRKKSEDQLAILLAEKQEISALGDVQEAGGALTPEQTEMLETNTTQPVDLRIAAVKKWLASNPDKGEIEQDAYDWFTKNADHLAVAAALNNLY